MLFVLDRDGVINVESNDYIKSPDEWIPIPGSIEAIALLSKAGFSVVIATNQSGVARGLFSMQTLELIHQKMDRLVEKAGGKIEKIYFCPHHPDENCLCRKPKIGLLQQIQQDFQINPAKMIMVGDSVRDLIAGKTFGSQLVLVKTGNGQEALKYSADFDVLIYEDLLSAVKALLKC